MNRFVLLSITGLTVAALGAITPAQATPREARKARGLGIQRICTMASHLVQGAAFDLARVRDRGFDAAFRAAAARRDLVQREFAVYSARWGKEKKAAIRAAQVARMAAQLETLKQFPQARAGRQFLSALYARLRGQEATLHADLTTRRPLGGAARSAPLGQDLCFAQGSCVIVPRNR